MPVIDPATFSELQDTAGAEFVVELISTFLEETPQMLADLHAARAEASVERFRRAAHSLKSNANTFGALHFGDMARDLELSGFGDDATALARLDAEYTRVAAKLRSLSGG